MLPRQMPCWIVGAQLQCHSSQRNVAFQGPWRTEAGCNYTAKPKRTAGPPSSSQQYGSLQGKSIRPNPAAVTQYAGLESPSHFTSIQVSPQCAVAAMQLSEGKDGRQGRWPKRQELPINAAPQLQRHSSQDKGVFQSWYVAERHCAAIHNTATSV